MRRQKKTARHNTNEGMRKKKKATKTGNTEFDPAKSEKHPD